MCNLISWLCNNSPICVHFNFFELWCCGFILCFDKRAILYNQLDSLAYKIRLLHVGGSNVNVKSLRVRLFVTPWSVAYQASPSMGFSRQEYWSGLPFPSPGRVDLKLRAKKLLFIYNYNLYIISLFIDVECFIYIGFGHLRSITASPF